MDTELLKPLINEREDHTSHLNFEEKYESDINVLAIGAGELFVTAQKVEGK